MQSFEPNAWQVKALRLLQFFPAPEEKSTKNRLADVLTVSRRLVHEDIGKLPCDSWPESHDFLWQRILGDTHPVKNVNRNNTMHAILFEAIRLIIELNL